VCEDLQKWLHRFRLDQIIHGIGLALLGLEFILGLLATLAFLSAPQVY
jgi:hypothetical protein